MSSADELKAILEKEHGREFSPDEIADCQRRLEGLAEICFDAWKEECRRKKKLEESPKGFQLDSYGYTCAICKNGTPVGENWYDKYGIKCKICQGSVDRKEIPASLAKDDECWYSKYDLESSFNLKGPKLRSWIKKGIIKARTVTYDGKGVHVQLFLIKDNKDFLPPKNLVKSQFVKVTKDGQDWYHSEPWYKFVEPFKHLKGYKIMEHMQIVKNEEKSSKAEDIKE